MLRASLVQNSHTPFFLAFRKKIHTLEIIDFTRELSLLLKTGISMTNALNIIANNCEKYEMQRLVSKIKTEIETGKSLGKVLKKHPNYFHPFFIQLVLIGEQSGSLDIQLKQAADYLEKWQNLKSKFKKALSYPLFIVLFTLLIMSGFFIFIIPQFQNLFRSFNAELPLITRLVIETAHYFKYAAILLLTFLLGCALVFFKHKKTLQIPAYLDYLLLKIPMIGLITKQHFMARICHLLAVTYDAGMTFPAAFVLLSETVKNRTYAKALSQIQIQIQKGITLHQAIANTTLFPKRVTQMIYIGEQSGELSSMLKKMGDYYENKMDQRLDQINKLLEPAMIVFLGLSIGFLIVAMYLPIFRIGSLF